MLFWVIFLIDRNNLHLFLHNYNDVNYDLNMICILYYLKLNFYIKAERFGLSRK